MNIRLSIRLLLATALSLGLVVSNQLPFVAFSAAAVADLKLKSESQLKSEAAIYDTAIREISQLQTMSVATVDDLKKANTILERQIPNLRFNRSKLATIGLSDSTFINAAKARTRDKKSTEDFANELGKDPNAIFKLNGATSLGDRMGRSLETDTAMLRRVAERLKQAAADIKAKIKTAHASSKEQRFAPAGFGSPSGRSVADARSAALLTLDLKGGDVVVVLLVAVAVIAFPGLGLALLILAGPAISFGVAGLLIGKLIQNIGTEEGRDKVAACLDAVEKNSRSCHADAAKLCCGLAPIATAACTAEWLFDSATCLLS